MPTPRLPDPPDPPLRERWADLGPGDRIGRYVLSGEIGRGGMGVVYRAHDPALGRDVAVKVLPADAHGDPERVERLRAEARAASALDHPHVCTVFEVGESEAVAGPGRLFVAMALYEGEALDARLARGPLPVAEAVDVARQVALGLGAAHRKGVVHRDVKPSNVFLTTERSPAGGPCVKLLDFGVAHVEGAPLTRAGTTLGTIEYAAPEQAHSQVGPAADQWGLGVLLYEMLAGRRPFDEPYEAALLYAVLNLDPPPLRDARPDVPEALAAVVERLLAKRPEGRFATADEAAAALDGVLSTPGPSAAPRPVAARPPRTWPAGWSRRRAVLGSVAFAVVALAAWAAVARALPDEKHVAVLPFRSVGSAPAAQAFADGLAETLASSLTQLEQYQGALWVVPASEVRAQGVESPSAARRALGATLVVEGTVERAGGHVRVLLNLVDAETLRQLRSTTVDVTEARLNTLSAEVAAALEGMLDLELRPEARARLAAGGTSSPEASDALLQGVGYLDRSTDPADMDRAVVLFERAIAHDPEYALASAQLGEAYVRRFEDTREERWLVRAEASAREALGLAPEESPVYVLLSGVARMRGLYPMAIARAERALALNPSSDAATLALARAHAAAGDDARAEQAYLRAVHRKPGYWRAQYALGRFYYDSGRWAEAARRYRAAVALAPDNTDALNDLGGALYQMGRPDEARVLFERSAEARPNAEAFSNLGTIYYGESRFAESVRAYERSLAADGSDIVVWGNLASVYGALGRLADVRRAYIEGVRRAEAQLAVNARDAEVQATLASYYAELGRPHDARRAADRAAVLDPSVDDQTVLAAVYGTIGDGDAARRWLRQALAGGYSREFAAEDPALAPFLDGE